MLQLAGVHEPGEAVQVAKLVSRPPELMLHVPSVLFQFHDLHRRVALYASLHKMLIAKIRCLYKRPRCVAIVRTLLRYTPEPKFCNVIVCVASVLTLNISCIRHHLSLDDKTLV